jgi:hypothetical protein
MALTGLEYRKIPKSEGIKVYDSKKAKIRAKTTEKRKKGNDG